MADLPGKNPASRKLRGARTGQMRFLKLFFSGYHKMSVLTRKEQ
jgi:hypothetical protein